MKHLLVFALLLVGLTSCSILDNSCDKNLAGIYDGRHTCFSITGSYKTVTVEISGEDGNYGFSFSQPVGIDPDGIDQDGCGFDYSSGTLGNKRTGKFTFELDTLRYEISGNSFGAVACTFKGVRK